MLHHSPGALAACLAGLLATSCSCQPPAQSCADDDQCPAGYRCLNAQCFLAAVVDGGQDATHADRGVREGSVPDLPIGDRPAADLPAQDHGVVEASLVDGAQQDAATVDAEPGDRLLPEAGGEDLSLADTPLADQAAADQVAPDGPAPDATARDAALPEVSVVEASVVDGSVPVDGGADPGEPCGTVGRFRDSFTYGLSDIWAQGTTSTGDIVPIAGDGTLRFAVPLGSTARWGRVQTWARASLRSGRLSVRVASTDLAGDVNARAYLEFGVDDDNRVTVALEGGTLWAEKSSSLTLHERTEIGPFELDRHRWWSLHAGETLVRVEVSGDGLNWSPAASFDLPPFAERGHVALGAGTSGSPANLRTSYIAFDDLNLNPGRVAVPWCLASSVREDFSTLDLATRWSLQRETNQSCVVDALGGELTVSIPAGQSPRCSISSTTVYDLRHDAIQVQVTSIPEKVLAGIFLWSPQLDVEFGFDGAQAVLWQRNGINATLAREGADTLFVRHDGDNLVFSFGVPGGSEASLGSLPGLDVDGLQIDLGVRPHGEAFVDNPTTARFDDYNP